MTSSDHRAAAELIAELIPRFDAADLGAWLERSGYRPRYNVGPGQDHWVVRARGDRPILARAHWGLPGRSGQLLVNARAETVSERPTFRAGFEDGRCLVVADGFFEWDRSGSRPQPWWFRDPAGRGLLFAAVQSEGRFVVITTPANPDVEVFHSRMPALIDSSTSRGAWATWLFGSTAEARPLLASAPPGSLRASAVSRRINSIEHDDPACVQIIDLPRPRPAKQLPLM
jgi:putative SOS response-associated peptidase YedK